MPCTLQSGHFGSAVVLSLDIGPPRADLPSGARIRGQHIAAVVTGDFLIAVGRPVAGPRESVSRHQLGKRRITRGRAGIPMQYCPIRAEDAGECIPRRQSQADTETPLAGLARVGQIVRMADVHDGGSAGSG